MNPTIFLVLLLTTASMYVVDASCPAVCQCPSVAPTCPPGVSLLTDSCGCCRVCASQLNQDCSDAQPCDHHKGLECNYGNDAASTWGVCRAKLDGRTCEYAGRVYQTGESFSVGCKHQCTCVDGAVGCGPLCHDQRLPMPSPHCPSPRLVRVPGECCFKVDCHHGGGALPPLVPSRRKESQQQKPQPPQTPPQIHPEAKQQDVELDHNRYDDSNHDNRSPAMVVVPPKRKEAKQQQQQSRQQKPLRPEPKSEPESRPRSRQQEVILDYNRYDDNRHDNHQSPVMAVPPKRREKQQQQQQKAQRPQIETRPWPNQKQQQQQHPLGGNSRQDDSHQGSRVPVDDNKMRDNEVVRRTETVKWADEPGYKHLSVWGKPKRCVVQTTDWSPCSSSCGVGVSSRITNDNVQCKLQRETRLCNIRPCSSLAVPPKKGKKCTRTRRSPEPVRLTYTGCRSLRLYRPTYCGSCVDGRCCQPSSSRTLLVPFRCSDGDLGYGGGGDEVRIVQRAVMFVQSCRCSEKDCGFLNEAALQPPKRWMYGDTHKYID
ncbi:CCN family member 1-like [Engraulis encrasicolus]|uniref:CCN family member 1-like n=1 Tax=Engraulis encrasicolus TaxID=184585 RepID=UPI002FD52326